ncbi:hypothetical protein [uncultured Paracoccus sp.]|uniref:hypothetical protein n=1 Tax=uncultured Paracoccus sp. TaxID=189685 RepID=UPI002603B497|nr:hypothetical protein [uncultured Paracoccus sp.]
MHKSIIALAFSAILATGPAMASYSPETGQVPQASLDIVETVDAATVPAADGTMQLAIAWNGCSDPWYYRSGWQVLAELIWDVCG